jgi:hypothetical protein
MTVGQGGCGVAELREACHQQRTGDSAQNAIAGKHRKIRPLDDTQGILSVQD